MNDVASRVETMYHSVSGRVGDSASLILKSTSRVPIATKSIRNDVFTRSQMKEPIVLLSSLPKRVSRRTESDSLQSDPKRTNVLDSSVAPLEGHSLPSPPLMNSGEHACFI